MAERSGNSDHRTYSQVTHRSGRRLHMMNLHMKMNMSIVGDDAFEKAFIGITDKLTV